MKVSKKRSLGESELRSGAKFARGVVARIDARINFLNAGILRDRLVGWLDECPSGTPLVIDASGVNDIDYTGVMMLVDLHGDLQALGHALVLCEVKLPVRHSKQPGLADLPMVPRVVDGSNELSLRPTVNGLSQITLIAVSAIMLKTSISIVCCKFLVLSGLRTRPPKG